MRKVFGMIVGSYALLALVGALVLDLGPMHTKPIAFLDLFFTATSAVCLTGLITANPATDFTHYGQAVLLGLIQAGGFGYMGLAGLLFLLLGKKMDFQGRLMLKESLDYPSMQGVLLYLKQILLFTLAIEGVGVLLLSACFAMRLPFKQALWAGLFHSISAFNNAGFSIFASNLMDYQQNAPINFVVCALIILGGLGFLVLSECANYRKNTRLSVHTRIVLWATLGCLVLGVAVVLLFEWDNPKSIGSLSTWAKVMAAFFLSVNLRTAGFNTIDMTNLHDESLFFSSLLMVIGAAPGSTAGGIKITTLTILLAYAYHALKGQEVVLFKRTIPQSTVKKSFLIFIVALFYIVISAMLLSATEDHQNKFFLHLFFEICSAFGTVGVSTGNGGDLSLVAKFSSFGKLYLMLLMFMGRVGVLVFSLALVGKSKTRHVHYPEEEVVL
ncbi:Potassium uptake protein TrkH [Helicobacter heilmannii]|uniref:Potassium uptake protein, integral membrane component, KtrB n=1 Tax=Helicobacter heilmannii TaxID=35817 RepID=A0A0K2YAA1_HELHE|nr:TrkH family potassium uptake protein [Helicobacter heilmannii]CCM11761.1 Potassium uptake protein, integral membrane component, KtrB [Helicobacter heilmannii ASB1.4]CRF46776.1 Potassium uptake protein TrkH [Helicobacter heilmannii]CRF49371.1 Potassium uptake protein TrkH [Helicobacter heilmannii]CRI33900.1 Potassium uptake protein, integral membrane component, KtrB [Helicobacter heilmannii]GMB95125.1 TrkH family potassium uptake protein [Helicobacter heilmannii]